MAVGSFACLVYDEHTNCQNLTILNPAHVVTATQAGTTTIVTTVTGKRLTVMMSLSEMMGHFGIRTVPVT